MIFSNEPDQIELERIMTQPPFYRPRGHGKYVIKTLLPDKESCNCGYCLYADRKKCTLTKCPYIEEGITAGSVSRTEALIESVRDIHNTAFRKRFNRVLMKREEGEIHGFRGEIHRSVFLKAIEKISPDNKVALSALYLLTADGILWKQVSRFVDGSHISFEKIRIMNSTTDTYALFCVAKDFSIGTKHAEGVYYVTGHVTEEADATVFYPVTSDGAYGKIVVKGLEDDEYVLTEVETANGYVLLRDPIHVVITAAEDEDRPCTEYTKDLLGVLQNDPHYAFDGGYDLHLSGIPQKTLVYNMLTASATVDGNAVDMREDNGSANAEALLTVVNNPGFDLPDTGDNGTMLLSVVGIVMMAGAALVIVLAVRKKSDTERK